MEASPSPDIPDPASATPVNPRPAPEGAAAGMRNKPRIQSRPTSYRGSRLPGTYAANYEGDMNWRRGVAFLWVLFGLVALGEAVNALVYLLMGYSGWPLRYDMVRIIIGALGFLMLWIGWSWTRWLLAVVDILSGFWLIVWGVASRTANTKPAWEAAGPLPDSNVEATTKMILGGIYLGVAIYLVFSADLIDFLRHRREEGRGWVVAPVTILVTAYVTTLFFAPLPYTAWIKLQLPRAERFGRQTEQVMAERWLPESVQGRYSAALTRDWPPDYQQGVFTTVRALGPLQDPNEVNTIPFTTGFSKASGWFSMRYSFQTRQSRFAHGTANVGLSIVKPLFGSWQIDGLTISEIHFEWEKPDPASVPTMP